MSTSKTYDKQTAAFIAVLTQNIPEVSSWRMQDLIDHPEKVKNLMGILSPTLKEVIEGQNLGRFELHELVSGWDFMILTSPVYPEVGIAVSNRSGTLGMGLTLHYPMDKHWERFICPCGCCRWEQAGDEWFAENGARVYPKGSPKILRNRQAELGLKHIVFECWGSVFADRDGHPLVSPCKDQMSVLDKQRFLKAFGVLKVSGRDGVLVGLESLFD